jgi:uncharacterized SAM-binding protein YcdF (DUF218 family)
MLLFALAVGVVAVPLTVVPETVAAPSESDVVVVLAGGRGERLDTALALMDRQIGAPGPLLAISNGDAPEWPQANELCGTAGPDYSVVCFEPDPQTTRGEAMAIAGMAETLGAHRIAIVTSTYHATRARLLVERCLPDGVELEVVAAPVRGDLPHKVRASLRELMALAGAVVRGGEC